jgi:hypothetical protein
MPVCVYTCILSKFLGCFQCQVNIRHHLPVSPQPEVLSYCASGVIESNTLIFDCGLGLLDTCVFFLPSKPVDSRTVTAVYASHPSSSYNLSSGCSCLATLHSGAAGPCTGAPVGGFYLSGIAYHLISLGGWNDVISILVCRGSSFMGGAPRAIARSCWSEVVENRQCLGLEARTIGVSPVCGMSPISTLLDCTHGGMKCNQ